MKQKTPKPKKEKVTKEKTGFFSSIKGKIFFMGGLSLIASAILGYAGLTSLNKNHVNNEILSKINQINVLQYENQSLDTSYLYFLEDTYLKEIVTNLQESETYAKECLNLSSGEQKTLISGILEKITDCRENYEQILTLSSARGFDSSTGSYAKFLSSDAALLQDFQVVANDKSWVDGKWSDTSMFETTSIDGTAYAKVTYNNALPQFGKRNTFLPRIGGSGVVYTGTIYLTNLSFTGASGTTAYDLSALTAEELANAYGDGLAGIEIATFNGAPAIKMGTKFSATDGSWQEITLKIPVSDLNIQNYTTVVFDVYFETAVPSATSLTCALSDKYDFTNNLHTLNSLFSSYSQLVIEGKDFSAKATEINNLFTEMVQNLPDYVTDDTMKANLSANLKSKQDTFAQINKNDSQILLMKQDNISIATSLAEETASVRALVEADTNAAKTGLTLTITIILVVTAVLLIAITAAISYTLNRSIRKFRDTLNQVTDGDLTVRADHSGKDEFSVFGKSLNNFLVRLADSIRSAQEISASVSNSGDVLREMASDSTVTSEKIEQAVEDISDGAAEQADDIENAFASITNMGSAFEKIVTNIESLNALTADMQKTAQESTAFMSELAEYNSRTTEAFKQVSQQIHITNESVNKIHEAADFITAIASETSLLSLNASIEAARAGEAGKGFAVVATEIQKLSDQSNTSALNIESIIEELSKEASKTVTIVDEVFETIAKQQEKLLSTQERCIALEGQVQTAGAETGSIKNFTENCDLARKNVEEIIENLSAISEQNSASTEETKNSMSQLNDTIIKLADASNELNRFAEQLETDLKFFRLS
ncbi:MAG: methyl-accepting chemotaxis protein [Lachnospiraceae bacterium]|nr:methyl-accepting chemotaxis protein [Lachnospiraceae bacterium]